METPTILRAIPVGPYLIEVAWLDGPTSRIDLEHVVMTRPEYKGIKKLTNFKAVEVSPDGKSLRWSEGMTEMSSGRLWRMSQR